MLLLITIFFTIIVDKPIKSKPLGARYEAIKDYKTGY